MKAMVIFLNCYILILSVLTCRDEEEMTVLNQGPKIELSQQSGVVFTADVCPPFCICACCGISRTASEFVQLVTQLNVPLSKRYSAFNISLPGQINHSFWQPPQVA